MATKNQLAGGAFQDLAGNLLASGYLLMTLSQDGQVNGNTQVSAGVEIKILLDASGNVASSPAQSVWPNDVISPSGTFYTVSAYTAEGQLVWGPNAQQVLSSPSPYNIGAWVPATVNTGAGSGSGSGAVASVFGRTGAVVAEVGDYASFYEPLGSGGVSSVFGRTGAVVGQAGDYTAAQIANAAATNVSNTFSQVQTFNAGLNATSGTFTSYITAPNLMNSFNGRSGSVVPATGDYTVAQVTGAAPLNSPAFTGTPTGLPFQSLTTTGTSGAATLTNGVLNIPDYAGGGGAVSSLTTTGTSGPATLSGGVLNIPDYAGGVTSVFGRTGAVVSATGDYAVAQVTGAAPIDSPTFTGTVTTSTLNVSGAALSVIASGGANAYLNLEGSGGSNWQLFSDGTGGGKAGWFGFYDNTKGIEAFAAFTNASGNLAYVVAPLNGVWGWNSQAQYPDGTLPDTGLSRSAAGVVCVGNGVAQDASGTLKAAELIIGSGSNVITVEPFLGGYWIDMPTTGPSAIGSGGSGSNTWLGYVASAGQYFTDAAVGDIIARASSTNTLRFGVSGGASQVQISSAGMQVTSNLSSVQTTAATSAVNYDSPTLTFSGNYWNGSASAVDTWTIQNVVSASGVTPNTSVLQFSHTGASGGGQVNIPTLVSSNFTGNSFYLSGAGPLASVGQGQNATSTANYSSGYLQTAGNYWDGTETRADTWSWQTVMGTGTNPSSTLQLWHGGSNGGETTGGTTGTLLVSVAPFNLQTGQLTATALTGTGTVTAAVGSGAGTGASVGLQGHCTAASGQVVLATGTSPSAGNALFTISWTTPLPNAPNGVIVGLNGASAQLVPFLYASTTTSITFAVAGAPPASTSGLGFSYVIIG